MVDVTVVQSLYIGQNFPKCSSMKNRTKAKCIAKKFYALLIKIILIILTDRKLYCHYVNVRRLVIVSRSSRQNPLN